MKKMVVISGILVILFFLSTFASAQGPSYVMICKGGGDMRAAFDSSGKISILAKGGSRAANPGPGECVWVDRGMRAEGEMRSGGWIALVVPPSLLGSSPLIKRVRVSQGGILEVKFNHPKAKYLFDAIHNGTTFYLHARRIGIGHFEVTKIGP